MTESISVSSIFNVTRQKIYQAWLNSREHTAFTGSKAAISARKGAKFTAWDGYISGKNLELTPNKRILQSWRTTEFSSDDPDSLLEILLDEKNGKTTVTIRHTNIPEGQGKGYKKGWVDFYFKPMKAYFV
jgi:activator of HSP90 ATPase